MWSITSKWVKSLLVLYYRDNLLNLVSNEDKIHDHFGYHFLSRVKFKFSFFEKVSFNKICIMYLRILFCRGVFRFLDC